jgi:hypothetical protein
MNQIIVGATFLIAWGSALFYLGYLIWTGL